MHPSPSAERFAFDRKINISETSEAPLWPSQEKARVRASAHLVLTICDAGTYKRRKGDAGMERNQVRKEKRKRMQ
jgi:hypothetical protein